MCTGHITSLVDKAIVSPVYFLSSDSTYPYSFLHSKFTSNCITDISEKEGGGWLKAFFYPLQGLLTFSIGSLGAWGATCALLAPTQKP